MPPRTNLHYKTTVQCHHFPARSVRGVTIVPVTGVLPLQAGGIYTLLHEMTHQSSESPPLKPEEDWPPLYPEEDWPPLQTRGGLVLGIYPLQLRSTMIYKLECVGWQTHRHVPMACMPQDRSHHGRTHRTTPLGLPQSTRRDTGRTCIQASTRSHMDRWLCPRELLHTYCQCTASYRCTFQRPQTIACYPSPRRLHPHLRLYYMATIARV